MPLVLDYDRDAVDARKRRRDLLVGMAVLAAVAGVSGYLGFCCCGIAQTFSLSGGSHGWGERVERVLAGLVAAVLLVGAVVITGGMREADPPSEDIEDPISTAN